MYTGTQVNRFANLVGPCGLVFGILACQPVFVIGWREFFFIFILAALLLGPLVYRFIQRLGIRRGRNREDESNDSK